MTINDVPLASQSLGITQPLIRGNFQTIDAAFAVDHVPYTLSGQGKHNQVTFPVRSPQPTFSPGDIGLYNYNNSVTTNNELYITNAAGTTVPMTASLKMPKGYTYLPSGMIIQWGLSSFSGTLATVTFAIPYTGQVYSVVATLAFPFSGQGTIVINNFSGSAGNFTGFTANGPSGQNFYWQAIGF